jgi:glycosyltransferase involved in cell wall biosynthesis
MPRSEMGIRARQWVQAEYSWGYVAQEMLHLYSALASPLKNA